MTLLNHPPLNHPLLLSPSAISKNSPNSTIYLSGIPSINNLIFSSGVRSCLQSGKFVIRKLGVTQSRRKTR